MNKKDCCLLWAKANLKWAEAKVGKMFYGSDELNCEILFGNHGH